jgi:hypothetical protein
MLVVINQHFFCIYSKHTIMIYTNINELKHQLNIEDSYTGDTAILTTILNASEQAVMDFCNAVTSGSTFNLSGSTSNIQTNSGYTGNTGSCKNISTAVLQGTYLLAAHLYVNRSIVSFTQGFEIPFTLKFLLNPYKNFVIQ